MKRIPANQLTQAHYAAASHLRHPRQTRPSATRAHARTRPRRTIIRAKGAHPFDAVRIPHDSIVEVGA